MVLLRRISTDAERDEGAGSGAIQGMSCFGVLRCEHVSGSIQCPPNGVARNAEEAGHGIRGEAEMENEHGTH